MKRKLLIGLLAAEAAACVALCFLQTSFGNVFSTMMAFPFEQIGLGLRSLSLSGGALNVLALVLYGAISLLPMAFLMFFRKKRKLQKEDWLLGLLSVLLFVVLYAMTNPGLIGLQTGGLPPAAGKAALGLLVYSVLCGYLALRVLRLFYTGGTEKLLGYASAMLMLIAALFVYAAFGAGFSNMLKSFEALRAGNTGNEHLLAATYICLAMEAVVNALPRVLGVVVVFKALVLLDEMKVNRYSESAIAAAKHMCRWCAIALAATMLSIIGFNLVQLLFSKALLVTHVGAQLPVDSIGFMLAVLLFTRLLTENKQLKDDNDMFI